VNNSRNLALKLQVYLPAHDTASRHFFSQAIPLYAAALRRHLLKEPPVWDWKELPDPTLPDWKSVKHAPNAIAESIIRRVHQLYQSGTITGDQLIVLNEEMRSFTDVCGACERIKNTPIPYSYSAFIKKFIFIYVITMPIGFAFNLGYYTIPVTTFIFYVLASLELIAEEIEDPFGKDSNDLPMQVMADNIKTNISEILQPQLRDQMAPLSR
jgi:putative membrane protein